MVQRHALQARRHMAVTSVAARSADSRVCLRSAMSLTRFAVGIGCNYWPSGVVRDAL